VKPGKSAIGFALISLTTLFPLAGIVSGADHDGVVMESGKTMILQDGKPGQPLDHAMMLSNGDKVMPDGKVLKKDGKQMQMRDGTIIMDDGRVMHGSHPQPMMRQGQPPQE
jgi:hypothetical protein